MRVLVVGASGAIGTRLVPQLMEHGHEVTGTYRSPGHAERIRALGAEAIPLDLLDRTARHTEVLNQDMRVFVENSLQIMLDTMGQNQVPVSVVVVLALAVVAIT